MAKIEIEGGGARICFEAEEGAFSQWEAALLNTARNWKDAVAIVTAAEIARREPGRTEAGSAGFHTEQGDEWRNGRLAGDEFAGRPGFERHG